MSAPYFTQVLASQRVSGTLFNTYTTAKTVLNQADLVPIPGNYLQVGSKLRVRAMMGLSNIVTTPGTVTFQVMMGTVAVYTTGAIQMTTTANTLSGIELEVNMRLDSVGTGTAAKFMAQGKIIGLNLTIGSGANPTVTETVITLPQTPAVGTGFDSTISQILDFFVGFSISNAGNGVQVFDYTVEQLN